MGPQTQKEVWRVQHATAWNGGLLSTSGNLLFQGRADGYFAAYAADSGQLIWESPTHVGITAPVSYSIDGEQYVTVVAGWGGAYGLASGAPRHKGNVLSKGRILTISWRKPRPYPNRSHLPRYSCTASHGLHT